MLNTSPPGLLISIEGVPACGKSSLAQALRQRCEEQGLKLTASADQNSTSLGLALRRILVDVGDSMDALVETLLAAGARRQNFIEVIAPSLARNEIALAERLSDSIIAFGHVRGLPTPLLEVIAHSLTDARPADLTFLLDVDPAVALERIPFDQRHRVEREPLVFHRSLRQEYLRLAEAAPGRITVIDAHVEVGAVHTAAWDALLPHLARHARLST